MRYVSSIQPPPKSPNTTEVGGLTAIRSVKAVQLQEQTVPSVNQQTVQQEAARLEEQQRRGSGGQFVDRRMVCRRVMQLSVLEELRSGVERRRHSQREGDLVDHVDEIV